jgi:hypothetical protein
MITLSDLGELKQFFRYDFKKIESSYPQSISSFFLSPTQQAKPGSLLAGSRAAAMEGINDWTRAIEKIYP